MKNKFLLSGLALASLTATAQQLQNGDISWPNSQKLADFVNAWTPGEGTKVAENGTGSVNPSTSGALFEDENFFVSRVKLKPIFRNKDTQVDESYDKSNDKRLVNWVPINQADGVHTDALPNGLFDSEVFSNWSYVSHWGDWISPHGWVPAALSDAAHKHGVLVSGVASIPYGGITSEWSTAMTALANFNNSDQNKEKLAKFLNFHGVDGLGYNSEFNGWSSSNISNLQNVHKYLMNWFLQNKNQEFENMWYDGTSDTGSIQFDQGLSSHNDGNFSGASLFWNYNWNSGSKIQSAINYAQNSMSPARDPLYLYAGHNMQGGEPTSNNWTLLKQYPISIGLWGAHNTNMMWSQRTVNGSNPLVMQDTYQKRNEQWFTNGNRNPVNAQTIFNTGYFQPTDNFFGMSALMSARSTLSWDLAQEPFISYFNLGNGQFLNWKGERQNDNEWYNLGVQDYMPTWRWWFTTNFLGKDKSNVPANGLDAQFTWNDAYMGGSCLNIIGSVDKEYLHLFKTKYAIEQGDVITVRYKLIGGKGNASIVFSTTENPSDPIEFELFDDKQEVDDEWVEFTHEVSNRDEIAGNEIAVIALGFEDVQDLNLYVGEISIVRNQAATPAAPEIKLAKVLRNNFSGIDAKVVFNMTNDKEQNGEPCYNSDVNTSLFKLYAQVDGKTKLMGITSSWAGMLFSIPSSTANNIKIGVSAVSMDYNTESDITWSSDLSLPEYGVSNDIALSQKVIKPNEAFSIGYVDPKHEAAKWEITNANTGAVVKTVESATTVEFAEGLSDIAPYNVKVTESGNSVREFDWMIQITSEAAGAMPKIYDITLNSGTDEVTIEPNDIVEVAYTGRSADGSSTRAISAEEAWVGCKMSESGLDYQNIGTNGNSFTFATWINVTSVPEGGAASILSVEDRTKSWPVNNWGWLWMNVNPDGSFDDLAFRLDGAAQCKELHYTYGNSKLTLGMWTHLAFVFEYETQKKFRVKFYINGIEQEITNLSTARYTQTMPSEKTGFFENTNSFYSLNAGDYIAFFGGRGSTPMPGNGYVDDLQVWNKALSAEEVKASMNISRSNVNNYPNLVGYFDFESDPNNDNTFSSVGANKNAKASQFALVKTESAQGEGQGVQTPKIPVFVAGNPFLDGTGYTVTTKPTWSGKRAIITEAEGSDTEGSANVTYTKEGSYELTLTLTNDYGSDSKTYPVITVGEEQQGGEDPDPEDPENPGTDPENPDTDPDDPKTDGIADLNSDNLRTYTVNDVLYVEFATSGNYDVAVYNVNGSLVAQRADAAIAGQTMRINLGAAGVYVVRVSKDGGKAQGFKVLRK